MSLRVIGAGVGRTGTTSLKAALEVLLQGPCYHMLEVVPHADDIPVWHQASLGHMPDWRHFLRNWRAAVDWPASAYWQELATAFPDALIVLSTRDANDWWQSASKTIFPASLNATPSPWRDMAMALFEHRFTSAIDDRESAIAAYEAHNARVLAQAPPERLLQWHASDGWAPLCDALGLAIPDQEFPHANNTAEFQKRFTRKPAAS